MFTFIRWFEPNLFTGTRLYHYLFCIHSGCAYYAKIKKLSIEICLLMYFNHSRIGLLLLFADKNEPNEAAHSSTT